MYSVITMLQGLNMPDKIALVSPEHTDRHTDKVMTYLFSIAKHTISRKLFFFQDDQFKKGNCIS